MCSSDLATRLDELRRLPSPSPLPLTPPCLHSPVRPLPSLGQYDIVKRMERMGKSVGMLTGQVPLPLENPSPWTLLTTAHRATARLPPPAISTVPGGAHDHPAPDVQEAIQRGHGEVFHVHPGQMATQRAVT